MPWQVSFVANVPITSLTARVKLEVLLPFLFSSR